MEIKNTKEMQTVAENFLNSLKSASTSATIIGLSGELGAGKTTFVQVVARALGITDTVNSPTFVIEKIYEIPHAEKNVGDTVPFKHLIHIDAYRLESPQELAKLGFAEIAADPANLILIEWPERLSGMLPADMQTIYFKHINEHSRTLSFDSI